MSFLQPWLLWALPLVALPIIIHLLNQRRFQTMEWGAMVFLLAANRMSRGYARIRRWLILACRSLAICGLIFALARPLASGFLGLAAGNRTDTTMILLDRSPSMAAVTEAGGPSKLQRGLIQLADALEQLKSDHWVLIDSATMQPSELASAQSLLDSTAGEATATSADVTRLLQSAYEYISANQTGRTDIWICSDLRKHDWNPDGGQWSGLQQSFGELSQDIRFYVLADSAVPDTNLSLEVTDVSPIVDGEAALSISLKIRRPEGQSTTLTVPIEFQIADARWSETFEMTSSVLELKQHRIPLGQRESRGWGRVSLPADTNNDDNAFFFTFDQQPVRHTLIVSDDAAHELALAAEVAPEAGLEMLATVVNAADATQTDWSDVGLVIWQAPLPDGEAADMLQAHVDQGGYCVLMPPASPDRQSWNGVEWQGWSDVPESTLISSWRGDADLLAHTQDGSALPVGTLRVRRVCEMKGEFVPLATLASGQPVLARVPTDRGAVYALATTTSTTDSSLASDGVVLYVMLQRAIARGAARLAGVRQVDAGQVAIDTTQWKRVAGKPSALSHEAQHHAGILVNEDQIMALNRSLQEDDPVVLADDQLVQLFADLDWIKVGDAAAQSSSLIQEIWRLFLLLLILALVGEAALCLPKVRVREQPAEIRRAA